MSRSPALSNEFCLRTCMACCESLQRFLSERNLFVDSPLSQHQVRQLLSQVLSGNMTKIREETDSKVLGGLVLYLLKNMPTSILCDVQSLYMATGKRLAKPSVVHDKCGTLTLVIFPPHHARPGRGPRVQQRGDSVCAPACAPREAGPPVHCSAAVVANRQHSSRPSQQPPPRSDHDGQHQLHRRVWLSVIFSGAISLSTAQHCVHVAQA